MTSGDARREMREDRSVEPTPALPAWLEAVSRQSATSPIATLVWSCLLGAVCLAVGVRFLPIAPSRADLIDPSSDFHRRWLEFTDEFGAESEIVMVISGEDAGQVAAARAAAETHLANCGDVVDVLGYVDWTQVERRSLQYVDVEALKSLRDAVQYTLLPAATGGAGVAPTASALTRQLQVASERGDPGLWSAALTQTQQFVGGLEIAFAGQAVGSGQPDLIAVPIADQPFPQPNHFREGRTEIVSCFPAKSEGLDGAAASVKAVRAIADELDVAYPELKIGLTGVPVLECDEMLQSSSDMTLASALSAIGVAVLLVLGFRGRRVPLIAVCSLAVAMAWSIGWAAISVGSLNILSISFAAILIGLGIDFSLHWLAHSVDESGDDRPAEIAVRTAARCGTGIATAAVTTATAFLVAGSTPFRGLAELGVIAGGGVVLCAMAALVVTPALASLYKDDKQRSGTPGYAEKLSRLTAENPWFLLSVSVVVVTVLIAVGFDIKKGMQPRIRYESNLLKMQPTDLPSVLTQQELESSTMGGLLFGVSRTSGPEEARKLEARLREREEVGAVWSLGQMIPVDSPERTQLIEQIAEMVAVPRTERFAPSDRDDTIAALDELATSLRLSSQSDALASVTSLEQIQGRLQSLPSDAAERALDEVAKATAIQAGLTLATLETKSDASPITASVLPRQLTRRLVGSNGTWLVNAFPAEPVWDEKPLAKFVKALREVDPEVTGTPVQNLEATRQIRSSYVDACGYALVAVALLLYLDASTILNVALSIGAGFTIAMFAYWSQLGHLWNQTGAGWAIVFLVGSAIAALLLDGRSAITAAGAALPSLLGACVTIGVLVLLKIDFNPANLIVLPLVLGIGVDDGVHTLHGLRSNPARLPAATLHALTMTSLTSAVGFGSLAIAAHRGLASLGITLVVGVAACYFITVFLLLPLAYIVTWRQRREDAGNVPYPATPSLQDETDRSVQDSSVANRRGVTVHS